MELAKGIKFQLIQTSSSKIKMVLNKRSTPSLRINKIILTVATVAILNNKTSNFEYKINLDTKIYCF